MKMSRRDRKNFNAGKSAGYAEGYAQGLHDGNPFILMGEMVSKIASNLGEAITDPKLLLAISEAKITVDQKNELCWSTGNYTDECDCELCMHKHECSGYGGEDDEID